MVNDSHRTIQPGIYRHFKGNLYEVYGVAAHTETNEKMVVYRALYGDYGLYVRPLSMFSSDVDKSLHPDATQKLRFELVVPTVLSAN